MMMPVILLQCDYHTILLHPCALPVEQGALSLPLPHTYPVGTHTAEGHFHESKVRSPPPPPPHLPSTHTAEAHFHESKVRSPLPLPAPTQYTHGRAWRSDGVLPAAGRGASRSGLFTSETRGRRGARLRRSVHELR